MAATKGTGKPVNNHRLNQQHTYDQQQDQPELLPDHRRVKHHANGDKKQPHQHIPKWLDVFFHLVPVFGFRDQHARDERTQRQ